MGAEVWLRGADRIMPEALDAGFTRFAWGIPDLLMNKVEVLSWLRQASMGRGVDVRALLVDYSGAAEYGIFDNYGKPSAVYPTWAPDEGWDTFEWLLINNVGEREDYCLDPMIQTDMRPVLGQKHMIVVHRIFELETHERDRVLLMIMKYQRQFPNVTIYVHCLPITRLSVGMDLKAFDINVIVDKYTRAGEAVYLPKVVLPTGRVLNGAAAHDPRYMDWFSLVGWDQSELIDKIDFIRFTLDSLKWFEVNSDKMSAFASMGDFMAAPSIDENFVRSSDKEFKFPVMRRRMMRNLGLKVTELDKFYCDTCILHNNCKLYRANSVCVVKGSETVGLADKFNTRNADLIIDGLGELLQKQVERVEMAQNREDSTADIDPELTKMYKNVFDQGVKLAKLIDPTLNGAGVQVNVGVSGGNVNAAIVANSDPRQVMSAVYGQLESMGYKRHEITNDMIKGVLESMAQNGNAQALEAVRINADDDKKRKKAVAAIGYQAGVVDPSSDEPTAVITAPVIDGVFEQLEQS